MNSLFQLDIVNVTYADFFTCTSRAGCNQRPTSVCLAQQLEIQWPLQPSSVELRLHHFDA
jgi:hypothetical protein